MPIEIKPIAEAPVSEGFKWASPQWEWAAHQPFSPTEYWQATGAYRSDSITGGATFGTLLKMSDPKQWTLSSPSAPLTTPALGPALSKSRMRSGAIELDFIDPFITLSQATGFAFGKETPLVGYGGSVVDPLMFLASKDIDIFGLGDTGAPARLIDYALAPFIVAFRRLVPAAPSFQKPADDNFPYPFQRDPAYWQWLAGASPDQIREQAIRVASLYVDPVRNQYLVDRLIEQFQEDQRKITGISSGDARIDYLAIKGAYAKKQLPTGYSVTFGGFGYGLASGLGIIPGMTEIASYIDPVTPEERKFWESLTPKQRADIFSQVGIQAMATDVILLVAAAPAMGAVLATMRAGGQVAATIARAYDVGLDITKAVLAVGVVSATTNWALEAVSPWYSETLGREIDLTRPISNSYLAGIANAIGYWSSGTLGVATAGTAFVRGAERAASALRRAGLRIPTIRGVPELEFYRRVYGGSELDAELIAAGASPEALRISTQRAFLSYLKNAIVGDRIEVWNEALRSAKLGLREFGEAELPDVIMDSLNSMEDLASLDLQRFGGSIDRSAETIIRIINTARSRLPATVSHEVLMRQRALKRLARTIDTELAAAAIGEYGPAFLQRLAGTFTPQAVKEWTINYAKSLGLNADAWAGKRWSFERWQQLARKVYQLGFDIRNAEMDAAAAGLEEHGKITLVQARHIFRDEVDQHLGILRGDDPAAALEHAQNLVRNTIEGDTWYGQWLAPRGAPKTLDTIDPGALANFLEDISPTLLVRREPSPIPGASALDDFQRMLRNEGLWEIAYKGQSEFGFTSFVRTRDGFVFKSPWIDYLASGAEQIELGNRGLLASKFDSVFRAWRTYRLMEYQRASLFRRLSERFPFSPAQIDQFHFQVLRLASEMGVQVQTIARLPTSITFFRDIEDRINKIARRIFGEGPWMTRSGELVDINWRYELGQAYRQAYQLNLTAGLTSHLKASFGPLGEAMALMSDLLYVILRFRLSPIFKLSETIESTVFNSLRLVNPLGDPYVDELFYRSGIGDYRGLFITEQAYDQFLSGLRADIPGITKKAIRVEASRGAAALSFLARQFPEDIAQVAERAKVERVLRDYRQNWKGGSVFRPGDPRPYLYARLAEIIDPKTVKPRAGFESEAQAIIDELTGKVDIATVRQRARITSPEDVPSEVSLTLRDYMTRMGMKSKPKSIPDIQAADGLWHVTTDVDAALNFGLRSKTQLVHQMLGDPKFRDALTTPDAILQALIDPTRVAKVRIDPEWVNNFKATWSPILDAEDWAISNFTTIDAIPISPQTRKEVGDKVRIPATRIIKISDPGGKVLWQRKTSKLGAGLGITEDSDLISITVNRAHASAIAERLRLAAQAARGETTPEAILNYFLPLMTPSLQREAQNAYKTILNDFLPLTKTGKPASAQREAKLRKLLFEFVRDLDRLLDNFDSLPGKDGRYRASVGIIGEAADFRAIDPQKIGVLQVGLDTRSPKAESGASPWELKVRPGSAWVIDHRLPPLKLPDDDEGLLRLLRQFTDANGDPLPGAESVVTDIMRAIDEKQKAVLPPASRIEDVELTGAKTAQALRDLAEAKLTQKSRLSAKARQAWEFIANPIPFKERQEQLLIQRIMRDEFPILLRTTNPRAASVFESLRIPEHEWVTWFIEDRLLYEKWLADKSPETWQELMDHATPRGSTTESQIREGLNELYQSEAWDVITTLWAMNAKSAAEEAFQVHFFSPYRSWFERSLNHPLLGSYPASWSYKAAREWARFLYQNTSLPGLRLGMSPAVALAHIQRAQAEALAMQGIDLSEWLENGPLGSTIFIFNLLMPGDWSTVPFPLSRTLREIQRGAWSPTWIIQRNIDYIGATRDIRLFNEALGEIGNAIFGYPEPKKYPGFSGFTDDLEVEPKALIERR